MRQVLFAAALCGCASTPPPAPAAATGAPELDEAGALERVHELFEAVDRNDRAEFRNLVTPGFVLFEEGHGTKPEALFDRLEGKPARSRACTDEELHRSAGALVYIGDCTESMPARGDQPAQEWQGWNTIVLVPDDGAWKAALWQWQRSGAEAVRARWNAIFRRGTGFTREPNEHLAGAVDGIEPGRALVLAMGQGRNALYLAREGWQVTGVDISDQALREAREAAAERGLTLNAVRADLKDYDLGEDRWDLVTMLYVPGGTAWLDRVKSSVAPGGLFVLEFFKKKPSADHGADPEELARAFSDWDIVKSEVVREVADWGKRDKNYELVRFTARKRSPPRE